MVVSFRQSGSRDFLVPGALIAALVAMGCSGSSGSGDAGVDGSGSGAGLGAEGGEGGGGNGSVGPGGEAGSGSGSGASGSGSGSGGSGSSGAPADAVVAHMYDGTVGIACQKNTDCEPPGGPGVNICSNAAFGVGPLWPDPVCVLMHCDPVGSGNGSLQYCDGPATDPTSPGICLATTSPAKAGMGTCLPRCQFGIDGGAPTGCQGKDACNLAGAIPTDAGAAVGEGYCFGGCTADSDCPADSVCQVDEGTCLTTLYSRTKMPGQGCTSADSASDACFCDYSAATNQGYCTQSCIVGGTPCPSGYLCDTGETAQLTGLGADGGTIPGFRVQNAGMAGTCRASCPGSGDAAGACPPNSSCSAVETVGPVCAP